MKRATSRSPFSIRAQIEQELSRPSAKPSILKRALPLGMKRNTNPGRCSLCRVRALPSNWQCSPLCALLLAGVTDAGRRLRRGLRVAAVVVVPRIAATLVRIGVELAVVDYLVVDDVVTGRGISHLDR